MLVIGHRGASAAYPENTEAAFLGAIAQGADGVELDVRRTADGTLAVCHDNTLADGRALLGLNRDDLPASMPVLADVLDLCRPLAVVNTEIKNWPDDTDFDAAESLAAEVVALLSGRGELSDERNLVSSFHLATIDRVRELAPDLPTGWLLGHISDVAALIERAASLGHRAVHPHHAFVNDELVARAHQAGIHVNAWTCDEPDRIRWLAEMGVDAVITNVPDVAREALGR